MLYARTTKYWWSKSFVNAFEVVISSSFGPFIGGEIRPDAASSILVYFYRLEMKKRPAASTSMTYVRFFTGQHRWMHQYATHNVVNHVPCWVLCILHAPRSPKFEYHVALIWDVPDIIEYVIQVCVHSENSTREKDSFSLWLKPSGWRKWRCKSA